MNLVVKTDNPVHSSCGSVQNRSFHTGKLIPWAHLKQKCEQEYKRIGPESELSTGTSFKVTPDVFSWD